MNLFDILGPVMVGPSSSHTAGAVRIGWMTQKLLGEQPVEAKILMYGSFAATGKGHGTDRGLVAGLLGMRPDDERIPDSFEIARKMSLSYSFGIANLTSAHPNSVVLEVKGKSGRTLEVQACSLGGGRIMINRLDGLDVNCSCEIPTLIVHNLDQPGHVAEVITAHFAHALGRGGTRLLHTGQHALCGGLPLLGGGQGIQLGLHLLHGLAGLSGLAGGGGVFAAAHQAADPCIVAIFQTHDSSSFSGPMPASAPAESRGSLTV